MAGRTCVVFPSLNFWYRNGRSLGQAFKSIQMGPGFAYFPAVSLAFTEHLVANFGSTPLRYPIMGFQPIQEPPYKSLERAEVLLKWMGQLLLLFDVRDSVSVKLYLYTFNNFPPTTVHNYNELSECSVIFPISSYFYEKQFSSLVIYIDSIYFLFPFYFTLFLSFHFHVYFPLQHYHSSLPFLTSVLFNLYTYHLLFIHIHLCYFLSFKSLAVLISVLFLQGTSKTSTSETISVSSLYLGLAGNFVPHLAPLLSMPYVIEALLVPFLESLCDIVHVKPLAFQKGNTATARKYKLEIFLDMLWAFLEVHMSSNRVRVITYEMFLAFTK